MEIKARLGDEVTKGQLLLRIGSTDVAMAISDYKKFQADEDLSRRALDRAKALLDRGAIAQKEMETAESVNAKSKVDVATSEERIRLLGGDPKRLVSILDITAPVSGTIVEQNVTHSAGVKSFDNSPNLFTIADLSKVWVLCDVYENNISQVHLNDYAEVRTNAYRDRVVRGRVSNIGTMLDPASRTLKVRLELDNQDGYMRPGMFAAARFLAQGAVSRMGLPATAILRLHDRDWVFLPAGDGKFRRTEVQTGGQLKDGFQEILAGIKPGQRVVASALQFSSAAESR